MGSGKSKLIRRLIDHYTRPNIYIEKMLFPIAVSYKEFTDEFGGDIKQLIDARVTAKIKKELHEKSKYLLLIDGDPAPN